MRVVVYKYLKLNIYYGVRLASLSAFRFKNEISKEKVARAHAHKHTKIPTRYRNKTIHGARDGSVKQ